MQLHKHFNFWGDFNHEGFYFFKMMWNLTFHMFLICGYWVEGHNYSSGMIVYVGQRRLLIWKLPCQAYNSVASETGYWVDGHNCSWGIIVFVGQRRLLMLKLPCQVYNSVTSETLIKLWCKLKLQYFRPYLHFLHFCIIIL